jgi:hypothetical protein
MRMSNHWRFLELSLPAPDLAASLGFYRDLGFTELTTGDIRNYAYAVVSDGRIAIGLHSQALPAAALSFVQKDTANWARQLMAAGFELEFQRLGSDDFHEFGLAGPGGTLAVLMEAPTFSPWSENTLPVTGQASYLGLNCADLEDGIEFWQLAGLTADHDSAEPDRIEMAAPALRLQLSVGRSAFPSLVFQFPDPSLVAKLERMGLALRDEGHRRVLIAPEGTRLEFPVT